MRHAIFSIRPQYVEKILSGEKTCEVRSRAVRIPVGSLLWIYATLPVGEISAVAKVRSIQCLSPTAAWERHKGGMGISKSQFAKYANGSKEVSIIELHNVRMLDSPIGLQVLRKVSRGFQPPQFYRYIDEQDPLLDVLNPA